MRPPSSAIGALGAIIVVLIVALTYLVSVDKAGAPQVAVFGASITLGMGALVTLIARGQGDASQTPTINVNSPELDAKAVADLVRRELERDAERRTVA